jgi:23S rRNA (guanine745-N1)-methyltransferase
MASTSLPRGEPGRVLEAVAGYLRCPVCAGPVRVAAERAGGRVGGRVGCERGHSFDIARQGYVSLTSGRGGAGTGDSAEMVMARERFLGSGHYERLAEAIAGLAAPAGRAGRPGLVVDLAGGTGYYLARVLDALPERLGACLDLSAPALRRAARAHVRAAAIGADVWQPLPLADGAAAVVMSVFGPRNAGEIRRILAPGGTLIVVTPAADHLQELREPLGLIGIDERKTERLADAYGDYGTAEVSVVRYSLALDHEGVAAVVAMGPSAWHIGAGQLAARVSTLPSPVTVTVDVEIRLLGEIGQIGG